MQKLIFILFVLTIASCNKNEGVPDWSTLRQGVIQKDNLKVEQVISKLLINIEPVPTNNDLTGQKNNLDNLVNGINKSGVVKADSLCYSCIYTLPAQSVIKVSTDSSGVSVSRFIFISTPKDNILRYVGIE